MTRGFACLMLTGAKWNAKKWKCFCSFTLNLVVDHQDTTVLSFITKFY